MKFDIAPLKCAIAEETKYAKPNRTYLNNIVECGPWGSVKVNRCVGVVGQLGRQLGIAAVEEFITRHPEQVIVPILSAGTTVRCPLSLFDPQTEKARGAHKSGRCPTRQRMVAYDKEATKHTTPTAMKYKGNAAIMAEPLRYRIFSKGLYGLPRMGARKCSGTCEWFRVQNAPGRQERAHNCTYPTSASHCVTSRKKRATYASAVQLTFFRFNFASGSFHTREM